MTARRTRHPPDHTHPRDVPLRKALAALANPVRLDIVRELAADLDGHHTSRSLNLPVDPSTASHHFAVLRNAGLLEQRDEGRSRVNRLRQEEFEERFPGLLALVLSPEQPQADERAAP